MDGFELVPSLSPLDNLIHELDNWSKDTTLPLEASEAAGRLAEFFDPLDKEGSQGNSVVFYSEIRQKGQLLPNGFAEWLNTLSHHMDTTNPHQLPGGIIERQTNLPGIFIEEQLTPHNNIGHEQIIFRVVRHPPNPPSP
jgi:hypothetical protein